MFQVKDKTTGIVFYKIPESHCCSVSIVDFEQINAS